MRGLGRGPRSPLEGHVSFMKYCEPFGCGYGSKIVKTEGTLFGMIAFFEMFYLGVHKGRGF